MINVIWMLQFTWTVTAAQDYYYQPNNVTRTSLPGLASYRSALTLDWLAAEDSRQRELASAYETDAPPARFISTDCSAYPRPAPGKAARLMLELLKNLEGDDAVLIPELVQVLVRAKLLVETSFMDSEPDFEALVKTPGMMAGEPHSTLPRIVAAVWMLASDPVTTRKYGWCPVKQVNKYLHVSKARDIARHMKALEMVVARARFVIEEFIQIITPINMYQRRPPLDHTGPSNCADLESLDPEYNRENRCALIRPTNKDIVRRIYAILPFFDRDHSNTAFLHKFRASIHGMSEGEDRLDREAAYYAAVLTPLVFLQQYRDTWCLLERFHRAIRLYQISHPREKRSALKLLQNFRAVTHKVQVFVEELPGPALRLRTTTLSEPDDEELHDKKDIRYLKELIKNLG